MDIERRAKHVELRVGVLVCLVGWVVGLASCGGAVGYFADVWIRSSLESAVCNSAASHVLAALGNAHRPLRCTSQSDDGRRAADNGRIKLGFIEHGRIV